MKAAERLLKEMFEDVKADYEKSTFEVVCEKVERKAVEGEDEDAEVDDELVDVTCLITMNFQEEGCEIRVECDEERQGKVVQDCLGQLVGAMQPVKV